ncbi:MAG: biotin--[acetyl-CoA-carboxylase] ligase [Bryobacteraceae bacterium]|nr:biotin--[acetyl-CoA-carboxylase] ligase [Bryobacteraceae bacterium]MCX7605181.1 biotin--[acetyl-CoA-carboxylase] ligase [Bryobacteraceae bacterium]
MRTIEWHETIDTTMRRAAELARAGCAAGTVVAARSQTAGIGRMGRTWDSRPGGLYFTLVLRPRLEPAQLPLTTLALGLGVADALQLFAGVAADLRWPNDVLVADRKLAGILAQFQEGALLAGVGLNVNQTEFPRELSGIATSLRIETGKEQDPEILLRALVRSIESHVEILETSGASAILRLFENASSYANGRRVTVELPGGEIRGITAGLTPEGFLRVRRDDGQMVTVTAGGVRPAP